MKWGEYSSDVQFILQQAEKASTTNSDQTKSTNLHANTTKDAKQSQLDQQQKIQNQMTQTNTTNLNERKSDLRKNDLVGIVKGIPQNTLKQSPSSSSSTSTPPSLTSPTLNTNKSLIQTATTSAPESAEAFGFTNTSPDTKNMEFNTADVRSSLDRKTSSFREAINLSDDSLQHDSARQTNSDNAGDMYRNGPPISSNGALAPPPYRNPPPPRTSPPPMSRGFGSNVNHPHHHQKSDSLSSTNSSGNNYKVQQTRNHQTPSSSTTRPATTSPSGTITINAMPNLQAIISSAISDNDSVNDNQQQTAQYRDLLQLITYQREKINMQQADITKVCLFRLSKSVTGPFRLSIIFILFV